MPERSAHPLPSFWTFQLGGWLAFGVAMALTRVGRYPLDYMVATKGTLAALGLLVSLELRVGYRRLLGRDPSIGTIIVVAVVSSYVAAAVWTAGYNVADVHLIRALRGRNAMIGGVAELFDGSVYHSFALLAWSILYFAIKHHHALLTERERSLRAEALAQRARLDALRYQLNPHFLFNTLNAISTLVVEQRTADAGRMIARLSDFLRLTLAGSAADEVSLAEELEWTTRYLDIEQVRFGDRLAVHFDVAPDALAARVPALLLQPLVENAVRHAVSPREEGGRITIEARRVDAMLRLTVADDGPGLAERDGRATAGAANGAGQGIGLANTRERLEQLYGRAHRLELRPTNGTGLSVVIELPYR